MKKTLKTVTSILTLLILIFVLGEQFINLPVANPSPGPPNVSIYSPTSYGRNSNNVFLNVTVETFQDSLKSSENRWIAYSLDNQNNITLIPNYQGESISSGYPFSVVTANTVLWVPDGWHNITVYAKNDYDGWIIEGKARVDFVVGTPKGPNPTAPLVFINSPNNTQVYEENLPVPYSFTISVPYSWFQNNQVAGELYSVFYTLDNSTNLITVAGRDMINGGLVINESKPAFIPVFTIENPTVNLTGTIPPQPLGKHTIMVYLFWKDYENNNPTSNHFLSHFSVGNQTAQPSDSAINFLNQPLIVILVIASITSTIIICLGLSVYFKKHKP